MNSYPEAESQGLQDAQNQLKKARKITEDALEALDRAGHSASSRLKGAPDAITNGATQAVQTITDTVGTTLKYSNPKHPFKTIGYWAMGIGLYVIALAVFNACQGVVSGVASDKPLPHNAPASAKASNATVRGLKLVTNLGSPLVEEFDGAYRTQLVNQSQQQFAGQNAQPIPLDRSRNIVVQTNLQRYQGQ
ncbi:hypothetical protein [Laspinema olomoucense]|uniref:Uncharacterized protein n=1 Tax=Laspinema olomoucense D3b TaxID=2953688 RepID=A0ABT2N4V7_9CYAN|nr:hypothetical protein [Laspinema sp. D3b]MCT7977697.1 hypothetical protein [Laspinema sp. D3b]